MLKHIGLYYRTIRHLKPIQIRYRLWYMLRNKYRKLTDHSYQYSIPKEGHTLELVAWIPKSSTFNLQPSTPDLQSATQFTFLNRSHTFKEKIDWNYCEYGKLWAYNLNYFEFLHQENITKKQRLDLIREFTDQLHKNEEGLEPYPISLRGINWIKFLSKYEINDKKIDASLYAQYQILLDNVEYHILGNHLLENGCSLLFGAFYFQDENLWQRAKEIVIDELNEQILDDGGHFERSVMYHCIILERLLDCYNVMDNNFYFNGQDEFKRKVAEKISLMLGWLTCIQWQNGEVPEVNDHVGEMMPGALQLLVYAERLDIDPKERTLGNSGYRKFRTDNYEVLVDAGNIGPDYVPGHAHSDIFSFLLRVNGQEILTETGTSTYENDMRRQIERSTSAHNTVVVENKEQNEVWSAFRVGRRGYVHFLKDAENEIAATHDGYSLIDTIHERHFEFGQNNITICDYLRSGRQDRRGAFYLHFYPGIQIERAENEIKGDSFRISFLGHSKIQVETYKKAFGYKKLKEAERVIIFFDKELRTEIDILAF